MSNSSVQCGFRLALRVLKQLPITSGRQLYVQGGTEALVSNSPGAPACALAGLNHC